jgi:carbohydrate-selective porin OprB
VRKTVLATLLILLYAIAENAAYGGDVTPQEAPQKINYTKHGISRIRTGVPCKSEKTVLFDSARSQDKPYLSYEPGEGYDVDTLDLQIKPSTALILQGTPNPNRSPGRGKFGVSWVMYLDFEKKLSDWGALFLQLEEGWGDTVEPDLALFSNVNHNAYDVGGRVMLRKFRYDQYLADKQITVRVGKLRPMDWFDLNNYSDDDDVQFLNNMFNNSPSIEWPSGFTFAEEINMAFHAVDFIELDLGHFEGDATWQQLFRNGMYIAQGTIKSAELLGIDPAKWSGNYRFYGWVNDRDHSKYAMQTETPASGKFANYGFGLSFDQMIGQTLGVFSRFGWQRPDLVPVSGGATVEWTWSGGIQINGRYWNRCEDHLSFAVGQDFVSKEYKDAGNPSSNEGHIESYYSWKLNRCLTVSPDVQLIWNPNGVSKSWQGDAEPIFVYGTRIHYVF